MRSWAATAQRVGDLWTRGQLPRVYVEQTLKKARKEVQASARDLSGPAAEVVGQVAGTMGQLQAAVERSDPAEVERLLQRLRALEQNGLQAAS